MHCFLMGEHPMQHPRTPRGHLGCGARIDRGVAGTVAQRERGPVRGGGGGDDDQPKNRFNGISIHITAATYDGTIGDGLL